MHESFRTLTTSDDAVLTYGVTRGERPRRLLVLIHGMASNMTRWSEFIETTALTDSWDLMRLDLRGHGRSPYRGPVGMEVWCGDLAAVLDAEGYQRAVVAGHCLGANLALHFAVRHPERTTGLVLIEPMPRRSLTGAMRRFQPARPLVLLLVRLIRLLNRLGLRRSRFPQLDLRELDRRTRAAMASEGTAQALLKRYAVPWHDLRLLPSSVYFQEFLEVSRSYPSLSGISAPVLALLSSGTFLSDPGITTEVLSELPDCSIETIESHHWIPMERPREMRTAIEQWCRGLEGG